MPNVFRRRFTAKRREYPGICGYQEEFSKVFAAKPFRVNGFLPGLILTGVARKPGLYRLPRQHLSGSETVNAPVRDIALSCLKQNT
jgi:hypothetical protein